MTEAELQEMHSIQWFHRIDLGDGIVTPGVCPHTARDASARFGLPEDLAGKRVLDIGAWDGLFSFEAERRGASVVAMDTTPEHGGNWGGTTGFNFAKRQLGSRTRFVSGDVYGMDPAAVGQFDIVFFFGVLYHLTNPMLALSNLLKVTGEYCLIETACSGHPDGGHLALWEFVPGLDNDPTNYWYPTPMGLIRCLQHAGFRRFDAVYYDKARMTIRAFPSGPAAMESSNAGFSPDGSV